MSRQAGGGRPNNGNVARGASFAAAKGAGLILVAVVIGIVLLQIVDDGSDVSADGAAGDTETTTTLAAGGEANGDDTTPDTTDAVPEKTPTELRVIVLNGGAPAGAAADMSSALQQVGYTNLAPAADWVGREQTGNAVLCAAGLEREATALATAVGAGTTTDVLPDPVPPGAEEVDCIVVVGAAAA